MNATKIKAMNPKSADVKYTGSEPEWRKQPEPETRASALISAFTWYNYHFGKKEVKEQIINWLAANDRQKEAKEFGRVPEATIRNQTGWLCRMNLTGLSLNEHEQLVIDNAISAHIKGVQSVKEITQEVEEPMAKPNIQDRLRDKMLEAGGEIESMYDTMISDGAKMSADYKPITILRGMNVAPQMLSEITNIWQRRLDELTEVVEGKDAQLVEGYSQFGKLQIKNLIKFCEQVIADCGSYVQIKKTERKPRKKKPVSPEKLTARFKYLKEFAELKLKSVEVTALVGATDAWLYETKKRKLIHVVADSHVGSFTVKGSALIGFDTTNSVQKTLRKPAEQLKELMSGGLPQMRKTFKDIKATETKFNGRGTENMILLKVR